MVTNRNQEDPVEGAGGTRRLGARWVIEGRLALTSAAHLGSGTKGGSVDMLLLRDRASNLPLLTGASIAGSLRSYLADRELGYRREEKPHGILDALFGGTRGDGQGDQSSLVVFDSVGELPPGLGVEVRDGVALDNKQGVASEHFKYDLEVLPAGTWFPLRLEVLVGDSADEETQLSLLVAGLQGLEAGEIPIGARKSRGLGQCKCQDWRVGRFDLTTRSGWLEWLISDHSQPLDANVVAWDRIEEAINGAWERPVQAREEDQRQRTIATVHLNFAGGLLIASPGFEAQAPDSVHLQSGGKSILPGTSLAGALRARAWRIASQVRSEERDAEAWVNRLFGSPPGARDSSDDPNGGPDKKLHDSRLRITEEPIEGGHRLRPSRIRVDRFTGGVVDGGLFDEEPDYLGKTCVRLEIRDPSKGESGLLLLLLKDLLSGDLALGGTSSVGRGFATGKAQIQLPGRAEEWTLEPGALADESTTQGLNEEVRQFHEAEVCP